MNIGPGISEYAPTTTTEVGAPRIVGGAKVAAVLVAIAPWLAALYVGLQTFLFVADLEMPPLQRAVHWGLVGLALLSAFVISRHLWRGVHGGGISPVRLLLWSTLPVWLPAEAFGQYLAQYLLRAGNPYGYAEASFLRIAGQFLAWGMTGSVVFGLAIAAFLWRAPARRLPGIALAWASLAPLALFVVWIVGTAQLESLAIRSNLIGYAWISLPFALGFAGAALGDQPRTHPRPQWVLGVGLGALVVFVAAAAVATGQALIDAQLGQGDYGNAATSPPDWIARAIRFAWLGLPLAALPLVGFMARLGNWPTPAGWALVAVPLVLLAIALVIDAAGPGAEHGLDAAYPRRLNLLLAYAAVAPIAVFALRRVLGKDAGARDGLVLASALFGLLWLAWRPGLLVLAPPGPDAVQAAPSPPRVDEAMSLPPAPPPAPPREVVEAVPDFSEGADETGAVEGGFMEGDTEGGLPGGVAGAEPSAPIPSPAEALVLEPGILMSQRTHGADVLPSPELYAGIPRATVTVVLHVNAGGSVTRVEVLRSSGVPELDAEVRSTLSTWRYRPWMTQGRATPVRTVMTFNFIGSK